MLLKTIHGKRRFDHIDSPIKPYQATYLYDLHSLFQNATTGKSFSEWLKESENDHGVYFDIYEDILLEFAEQKKRFGYVDFNDLLLLMRDQLLKGAPIQFKEILVDEYQDTNTLQGTLIDAFTCKSLFCVGDYDQSIYAFNGANIDIIGSFNTRYEEASVFTLTKNYRSSHKILSLATRVIEKNARLYPKQLEVTRTGEFDSPRLLIYDELFAQYQAMASLIRSCATPHHEVAVIFRNNSSADGIEASLREIGISCKRKGGVSFFDAKEVKAMIDLLTVMVNPRDMMAFIHLFEYAKGVGPALSKELFDGLYTLGGGDIVQGLFHPKEGINPFEKRAKNTQLGLFDDHHELGSVARFYTLGFEEAFLSNPILKLSKLSAEGAQFLHDFYLYLKEARRIKRPVSMVEHAVSSSVFASIAELLATKRGTQKDGSVDEKQRDEAKERIMRKGFLLRDLARNYTDPERFLNALTLGSGEMSEGEGVNLLSIHASKGLEFDDVYIVDLMDGRFPNRKLMSMGGSLEEERRLFYVATTRARDRLYLSYAKYDKIKKLDYIHSPFLVEAGLVT
jgi:DNA helicase-2/ATP-dependent DNA helicase PcrA